MSEGEEESFALEWKIKNFSMSPAEFGSFILSPYIRIKMLGNTEWVLKLYPKGYDIKGFVACFLRCMNLCIYDSINIELRISVFPQQPNAGFVKLFKADGCWGYNKLISIQDVLNDKDLYLPNDTLTLVCLMKCKNHRNSHNLNEEVFSALSREWYMNGKNCLHLSKCRIETIIGIQNKSITWPIRKFRSLSINERITIPFPSCMKDIPSLYLTLFKTPESSVRIEISREMCTLTDRTIVKCAVSVANHPSGARCGASDEFFFTMNHLWRFPNLRNWKVVDDEYFKSNGGTLYLHFEVFFANLDQIQHFERPDWCPEVHHRPERQVDVSTALTRADESSIVTLRAGGQSFKVHASVLKASSRVFCAMFKSDMKEKSTGEVEITDTDSDTLGRMVAFLYSGTAGELSTTEWRNLYALAHKYQVQSLVDLCSSNLLSSLNSSTDVCDILCFASLYHDVRLWKSAQAFFAADSDRILVSQEWKNFMRNDSSLAAKVMYNMLVKGASIDFF